MTRLLRATFALPVIIALASLVGLVAALTGDGPGDVIAWLTLSLPLIAIVWARARRRS